MLFSEQLFLVYSIVYPLEDVSRYRDSQLQVCQNCSYFINLRPHIANLDI